jgi:hypothetical protein
MFDFYFDRGGGDDSALPRPWPAPGRTPKPWPPGRAFLFAVTLSLLLWAILIGGGVLAWHWL